MGDAAAIAAVENAFGSLKQRDNAAFPAAASAKSQNMSFLSFYAVSQRYSPPQRACHAPRRTATGRSRSSGTHSFPRAQKASVRRPCEGFQQRHRRARRRMQKSANHQFPANPPGFSKSRVYPPAVQLILTRKDLSGALHSRGRDSRGILKG